MHPGVDHRAASGPDVGVHRRAQVQPSVGVVGPLGQIGPLVQADHECGLPGKLRVACVIARVLAVCLWAKLIPHGVAQIQII